VTLTIELGVYWETDNEELVDTMDDFDERQERLDERNNKVSLFEMGDGPGTGGRGADGGRDGGGFPGNVPKVAEEVGVGREDGM
jgi:hypothetical protein